MYSCVALRLSFLFPLALLFLTSCGPERSHSGEITTTSAAAIGSCTDPETPGTTVSVYSDQFDNCFKGVTYSSFDPAQTAVVHSGSRAISMDPGNWGGFEVRRDALRLSYSGIELWVHGGSTGGQSIRLGVDSGSSAVLSTMLNSALGGPIPAGEWSKVAVSFVEPTASNSIKIWIQGWTNNAQATAYVDDIQLIPTVSGSCSASAAAGTSCSDGNICNGEELCDGAEHCLAGPRPVLSDGNPCTADMCDPVNGITHTPLSAGVSCTYGSACANVGSCDGAGNCQAGTVPSELRVYEDGLEACFVPWGYGVHDLGQTSLVHQGQRAISVGSASLALDRNSLDGGYAALEFWVNGSVAPAWVHLIVLKDGAEIAYQEIVPFIQGGTWQKVTVPFSSTSSPGFLDIQFAAPDEHPAFYIDDIRLIREADSRCPAGTPAGTSCSDNNLCNGEEVCDGMGSCLAGTPLVLDDGNACTADSCDPIQGVLHTPVVAGTACSDGNACNGLETCDGAGVCTAGTPPVLDDGNPCTADGCDQVQGVTHTPVAVGTTCSDSNACNGMETCNSSGICAAGTPPALDDGNPCTADSCDAALGVVHTPVAAGTSCSDDNLCNGNETCNNSGVCVAGTPPVLDDGNPCTADSCIPSTGVVHSPIPGCGVIPPDPSTVAPPNEPTVATDIADSTAFLYSGATPIQTGVAEGTIEARRVAVIRGTVKDRDGNPVSGTTITILGHSEYGQTISRADGMFDMAVNGGGVVTVNYQKDGYLPAQRQVQAPWRDFVWTDEVRLVPYDTMISAVALGASTTQVARGSPVTDTDGTRQATVLFPPGTQASMVMPDGSTQPLAAMHVRATEYTVGPNGQKSMPAALPPTSGYTYAVELSVDEAMMSGATSVQFDRPVAFYVENFLGFPVGGIVPVGYYDRTKGIWVASDNGKIIKIISITAGLADLDTNGDGAVDDAATLAALGVTAEEQTRLAATYSVGTSLWRVPITHFTPYDCNWPYGCDGNCLAPNPKAPLPPKPEPKPDCENGSIIDCQNQGLGETAEIVGTPYTLHYSSIRVPGHPASRTITIPVSGPTLPSNVLSIKVTIEIAGRTINQSFSVLPNQTYVFEWDGKDAYGRPVQGEAIATITVGWLYQSVYLGPYAGDDNRSFAVMSRGGDGSGGGLSILGSTRGLPYFWRTQTWKVPMISWDARGNGVGGWSLNIHHVYDQTGRRLLLGNGSQRGADQASGSEIIATVAGSGLSGYSGDGGPAAEAILNMPMGAVVGADGTVFIADTQNHRIRRVGTDGIITTVAGKGTYGYSGDGGPAIDAEFRSAEGVAIGIDGALVIVDRRNHRIRRVGSDGLISTIAGTGTGSYSGDGGPATAAALNEPRGVAIGADGSLFIADTGNHRIRRLAPDGTIYTVVGTGTGGYSGDGGWATAAMIYDPRAVAIGPDGTLFIADNGNRRIRRVGPDGIITTVAGIGTNGYSGDGGLATEAQFSSTMGVAVGADGALFVVDTGNRRIRYVAPDGIISTIAGTGTGGYNGEGMPATAATLNYPNGVFIGADGTLFIVDFYSNRIRTVGPVLPGSNLGDFSIASEDGAEVYVFNGSGRHLRTLDAVTGVVRFTFGYNSNGRLVSVTDSDNNVTTIEWAGDTATAIVAPHGQRTVLTMDGNGYLAVITNPASETRGYTYTSNGLMQTYTDPRDKTHTFQYDDKGRLYRDDNPAGGSKQLTRTERADGYAVSVTTALGRSTLHDVAHLGTGDEVRTVTQSDGTRNVSTYHTNGTKSVTLADGTTSSVTFQPDPRFGMQSPVTSIAVQTPAGVSLAMAESRAVLLETPIDPLSVASLSETVNINGRFYNSTYTAFDRTSIGTTPEGRSVTTILDEKGRPSQLQPPGVNAMSFAYNSQGQLQTVTQGSRIYTIGYDAQGYPQTITDPLLRTISFTYDQAGRVKTQTLPGNRTVVFDYDRSGNLTSLTPPGRPAHGFGYTAIDLTSSYRPPSAANTGLVSTTYNYDLDGALSGVLLPDETTIVPGYDAFGRLETVTSSRGTTSLGYDSAGRVATLATADTGLSYGYDGLLVTSETSSGAVAGTVGWTYDNDFRVAITSVNGSSVTYQYDADSLLTGAGALTITRETATGRISGSTLVTVTTSQGYNAYGELESFGASQGGASLYSYTLSRDAAGRIDGKTETVQGATDTYVYGYDDAGRLATVTKNGVQAAGYIYDANGNRQQKTSSAGTEVGSYDDQDRMYAYGSASYAYRPNGELATKTVSGQTTNYDYDQFGNLRGVVLPDGTSIEYVVDGQNRRIGKKVNGVLEEGFLYENQLRPVAWLDGTGTVVARFVYGTRINVPEYMVTSTATYRIVTDHLGSPRLVVDTATGTVAQRVDYDEWGIVVADSNPGFQPFGFAGGLYDRDTGLVRFGFRDYDSRTGRWTSKDPLKFGGGDTNLYIYAANDPVNLIDPSGRVLPLVMMGAGAAIGATVSIISTWNRTDMSLGEKAQAALFNAGLGALSAIPTGIIGGALAGAVAGFTGNLYSQTLGDPCEPLDFEKAGISAVAGFGGGALSGALGSLGKQIVRSQDVIGGMLPGTYLATGAVPGVADFAVHGGIAGNLTAAVVTTYLEY